ncbi:MAG: VOC family protein [Gammaproteobacteria bacterium]
MTGRHEAADSPARPFHLAVPVHDLDTARDFYGGILKCPEGRSDATWVDFNLYGHQLVCHLSATATGLTAGALNLVDGDAVPVPHFGVVLPIHEWQALSEQLRAASVDFLLGPRTRFSGQAGEQGTFFVQDPSANVLEFKGLRDLGMLFRAG